MAKAKAKTPSTSKATFFQVQKAKAITMARAEAKAPSTSKATLFQAAVHARSVACCPRLAIAQPWWIIMFVMSQPVQNAETGAVAAKQVMVPRRLRSSSAALAGTVRQPDASVTARMSGDMAPHGVVTDGPI